MKDYICMEEERISYIRGRYRKRHRKRHRKKGGKEWRPGESGGVETVCRESVEPGADLESALGRLVRSHGLEGKRVDLVLAGNSLHSRSLTLPRAGRRTMRRMICGRLAVDGERGFGEAGESYTLGVDLKGESRKGKSQKGERRKDGDRKDGSQKDESQRGERQKGKSKKGGGRKGRSRKGKSRKGGKWKNPVSAMIYYGDYTCLEIYKAAFAGCGISLGRVLALPDCMARMAGELWEESRVLLVDAGAEGVGFYALREGHCLAWKQTALHAGRFCQEGAEELLYEEMAEQAEDLLKEPGEAMKSYVPECVVLMTDCLLSAEKGALYLEQRLGIPCQVRMPDVDEAGDYGKLGEDGGDVRAKSCHSSTVPGIQVRCLAACVAGSLGRKHRALELTARGRRESPGKGAEIRPGFSMGCAMFLLANVLAAAGFSLQAVCMNHLAGRELEALEQTMGDREYQERSRQARQMEKRIQELSESESRIRSMEEAVSGKKVLGMDAFQAFIQAMGPGMRIEGLVYEGDLRILQVTVSMERAEEVPDYVDRVRESGRFTETGHRLWEERAENGEAGRLYAVVYARLGTGGQDGI